MKIHSDQVSQGLMDIEIYQNFIKSPFLSGKHTSYFQVYQEIFKKYQGREVTFVEVGCMNGGSLFMWRDFFGKNARIIGVDFNPAANKWKDFGFEVYIGDQSDPSFWRQLFSEIGSVDMILDDGGHTNEQQIITAHECVSNINDGGMLVVEDTHASYMRDFQNPSKFSFVSWSKRLIDNIHSRSILLKEDVLPYKEAIYSIFFYESIVVFNIDRAKSYISGPISNSGESVSAVDYRFQNNRIENWRTKMSLMNNNDRSILRLTYNRLINKIFEKINKLKQYRLKKFF
ncbi:class I SAM-dependent methyltransferase [Polynucleobacter paneuropaeus]|nr:class I SAM-dependent methyltransferase [Polynucleobacter paneuropaeus]